MIKKQTSKYALNLTLFLILLLTPAITHAEENYGKILKYKGAVKVIPQGTVRGKAVKKSDYPLALKDTVKTKNKALAVLQLQKDIKVILRDRAEFEIKSPNALHVNDGKVLFDIPPRKKIKGTVIHTRLASIGVKGTRFLVDVSQDKIKVFLKKGALNIQSLEGKFFRHHQKTANEFDAFIQEMEGAFEDYSRKQKEGFEQFVQSFELKAGQAVMIHDQDARSTAIPPDVEETFRLFDEL